MPTVHRFSNEALAGLARDLLPQCYRPLFEKLPYWMKTFVLRLRCNNCEVHLTPEFMLVFPTGKNRGHMVWAPSYPSGFYPHFDAAKFMAEFPEDRISHIAHLLRMTIDEMPNIDPYGESTHDPK
jgi:hypothetical protein